MSTFDIFSPLSLVIYFKNLTLMFLYYFEVINKLVDLLKNEWKEKGHSSNY